MTKGCIMLQGSFWYNRCSNWSIFDRVMVVERSGSNHREISRSIFCFVVILRWVIREIRKMHKFHADLLETNLPFELRLFAVIFLPCLFSNVFSSHPHQDMVLKTSGTRGSGPSLLFLSNGQTVTWLSQQSRWVFGVVRAAVVPMGAVEFVRVVGQQPLQTAQAIKTMGNLSKARSCVLLEVFWLCFVKSGSFGKSTDNSSTRQLHVTFASFSTVWYRSTPAHWWWRSVFQFRVFDTFFWKLFDAFGQMNTNMSEA